jgi:hypothetical protein
VGEPLVFQHFDDEGWTIFARLADIPERPSEPPQRLPEYLVATTTFDDCTRPL